MLPERIELTARLTELYEMRNAIVEAMDARIAELEKALQAITSKEEDDDREE